VASGRYRHTDYGPGQMNVSGRAVEAGVAEGEDAPILGDQPVASPVGGGHHAHHLKSTVPEPELMVLAAMLVLSKLNVAPAFTVKSPTDPEIEENPRSMVSPAGTVTLPTLATGTAALAAAAVPAPTVKEPVDRTVKVPN
jgi:hypothetical protein